MVVAQSVLPFKVELIDAGERVTAHGALPLVVEALRRLVSQDDYRALAAALGYASLTPVRRHLESLVALVVAGGEHLDDLEVLRADAGLAALLGFPLSSPTQAKEFLYRFHQGEDGHRLTEAEDAALSVRGIATIRPEGPGLTALAAVVHRLVAAVQQARPATTATLDVDATLVEAHKVAALKAYEGTVGYQPQMAYWAEAGMWVTDPFRDGNVPAAFGAKAFLEQAFGALPAGIAERALRADTAFYDEDALTWADTQGIHFAVSADMTEALAREITALPEATWQSYRHRDDSKTHGEERQWAEVVFVPSWARNAKKHGQAFRYLAIRVRSRQAELFEDAPAWRHFAVVTNRTGDGEAILRWQRGKQGTVEHGHGVVKNDLAGGVLPCGRFGANAAWWRLNLLAHDLLAFLQAGALPPALAKARPKTLRFRLFNVAGRVVRHARGWILKLAAHFPWVEAFVQARRWLAAWAPS